MAPGEHAQTVISAVAEPAKSREPSRSALIAGVALIVALFLALAYLLYEKHAHPGTMLLSAQQTQADSAAPPLWQVFDPGGWATQFSLPLWWLLIEMLGLAAFPLAYLALPGLYDRGWGLSKTLGILLLGYITWLPVSMNLVPYGRAVALGAMILLVGASAIAFWWRRNKIVAFVRERYRAILIVEAVTLAAFVFFILIRVGDPDLWHISRTSETMQDFAFLNGILRSRTLPPIDPWFAGGYMNYYYFGIFLIATLIQITGIAPAVAYNLAIPTLFALTIGGVYSVVAGISRRPWVGLLASWCVGLAGNMNGIVQLWGEIQAGLAHKKVPLFDFWQSGHIIPGTITEFPYWSYLNGDLHPYVIDMPFEVLGLGIAASILFTPAVSRRSAYVPSFIVAALVIGCMAVANTWDAPTYAILILGCYLMAEWRQIRLAALEADQRWWRQLTWQRACLLALPLVAVPLGALVLYLPYYLYYVTLYTSVGWNTIAPQADLSPLSQVFGLWLFILLSYFTLALHDRWQDFAAHRFTSQRLFDSAAKRSWLLAALATVAILALIYAGVHAILFGLLAAVIVLLAGRRNSQTQQFIYLLALYSLAIVTLVEFIHLRDFLDTTILQRMNTVFKFYEQIWILLAVSSALAIWQIWQGLLAAQTIMRGLARMPGFATRSKPATADEEEPTVKRPRVVASAKIAWTSKIFGTAWSAALAVLLLSTAIFLFQGTPVRLAQRFNWYGLQSYGARPLSTSLDGFAFMYYWYPGDAQAITWLNEHVSGAPVILEATTDKTYQWYGRVASFTGLPDVVGWEYYEMIFRGESPSHTQAVDVATMFTNGDPQTTLALLHRYQVRYIYVGQLECLTYGLDVTNPMFPSSQQVQDCTAHHGVVGSLTLFDQLVEAGEMYVVYQNAQTTIFAMSPP